MNIGNETTGFGTSSTALPSSLHYIAPGRDANPPGIGVGAPQARILSSLPARSSMIATLYTAPCFIGDNTPAPPRSASCAAARNGDAPAVGRLLAVTGGHGDAVSLLLQGANIDQEDSDGNTTLMQLVGTGQFDTARLLIDAGANPAYRNHAGKTAADLAMAQGHFLEAAGLADMAASAAGAAVTALLGKLNRSVAFTAMIGTTGSTTTATTTTTSAATANTTTTAAPTASISSSSTTSTTYTVEDAFKAIANNDLAALESILPTLRGTRQDRQSQKHVPARSEGSEVWTSDLESTLLTMAACLGRSSLIPVLLDSGALLEHIDSDGDTALILAAKYGHTTAVKLLLQAGADMEHGDATGWTALIHAANIGGDEIVTMLVAQGANMEVRNEAGQLLMASALKDSHDAEFRSLSRQALKQPAATSSSISSVLAPSSTRQLLSKVFKAVEKNDAQLLKQLLAQIKNYRINIKKELCCLREPNVSNNALLKDSALTPLMLAAFFGYKDSLEILMDADAKIGQSDSSGRTALMWAALGGQTAAVEILLEGGMVNQADVFGATALIHAVHSGVAATVQALVDAGAKVDHTRKDGKTALMRAAYRGDTAIIKVLILAGARIDQAQPDGKTALLYATKYGHTSSVKALLNAKARVDQATKDGYTALLFAAALGHTAILKVLLRAGAKTNLARPRGMTALMYAAEKGDTVALQSLLRAGAAIDQVNGNGASALMCATFEGHPPAVKVLLEAGANFRLKAKDVGYTAMRIAVMRRRVECIELLRAKGADSDSISEENTL
jgi:ankyrin repeat protein